MEEPARPAAHAGGSPAARAAFFEPAAGAAVFEPAAGAAFFDLDKTVIARASMVAFGPPLYREGLISRTTMLRAIYGQLVYMHLGAGEDKLAKIRDSVLALTRGWDRDQVRQIVADTLEHVVEPISYAEALEEIDRHRRERRRVFLVSASPEEIVTPLAEYLGVDGAIASQPTVDEAGRYTGEMAFYAYGPYKAEAMRELAQREGIDLACSWSYSDSYTDLPMLEAVGHPVVVNPDRVLSKLAKERGWEVRTWERTVRLKDRRRPPGGAPGMATAAALAAAVAAVGIWRRRGLLPPPRPAQSPSKRRAATAPKAISTARTRSFLMARKIPDLALRAARLAEQPTGWAGSWAGRGVGALRRRAPGGQTA